MSTMPKPSAVVEPRETLQAFVGVISEGLRHVQGAESLVPCRDLRRAISLIIGVRAWAQVELSANQKARPEEDAT